VGRGESYAAGESHLAAEALLNTSFPPCRENLPGREVGREESFL